MREVRDYVKEDPEEAKMEFSKMIPYVLGLFETDGIKCLILIESLIKHCGVNFHVQDEIMEISPLIEHIELTKRFLPLRVLFSQNLISMSLKNFTETHLSS